MQRAAAVGDWDVDRVRDYVRKYVVSQPGDRGGVLIPTLSAAGFPRW
jgi:hypothetical protein